MLCWGSLYADVGPSGEGSVWSLWCLGGPWGSLASGYYVSSMSYDHIVHVKHALIVFIVAVAQFGQQCGT